MGLIHWGLGVFDSEKRKSGAICDKDDCSKKKSKLDEARKIQPRCVLWTSLSTKEDYKKVSRTYFYCPTCCVHLCVDTKGNKKYSCYERWHQMKAGGLKELLRDQSGMASK